MAPQTVPVATDLVHRLEQLEERVRHLEEEQGALKPAPKTVAALEAHGPATLPDLHFPESAEGLIPLFGKALLALAGAYLLRALTTSALVPPALGVSLAIAYPVFWMVMAARLSTVNKLTGAVYMAISVLAFAPMLWETTVNLRILPAPAAAAILAGYVVLGLGLAWRGGRLKAIAWLASAAGAAIAFALCIGTYDLAPFAFALLAMAAALEVAAVAEVWLGPRRLVAFTADLVILWLIDIYGRNANLPQGYQPISGWVGWGAPAALLLIFMAGTAARTLQRHLNVTVFETLELLAAMGLFVFAATRQPHALLIPGLILIACGVLCYLLAFKRLANETLNLHAYSAFGLALVMLGTVFSIPQAGVAFVWCVASLCLLWTPAKPASDFHGLAFLAAAGVASGLAWDTYGTLLRDGLRVTLAAGTVVTFAVLGVACWKLRGVARASAATMFTWIAAAGLASLLLQGLPNGATDGAWCAAIRTSLIVAAAVVVALVARYRRIRELYWLVPGAMLIALGRLIVDDMPVGRPETLFISLLFYGGALLLLSKLMRGWRAGAC